MIFARSEISPTRLASETRSPSHPPAFGVEGMDLEHILVVPDVVRRTPRLRPDIVLRENTAGCQKQREKRSRPLVGRHIFASA